MRGVLSRRLEAIAIETDALSAIDAGAAHAQSSEVVPPRVVREVEPSYPEGSTGDAAVDLELVVDDHVLLHDIKVLDGPAEFWSEAIAAAARSRFSPAIRAGVTVTARFHLRITFRAPAHPPSPPPTPTPVPTPSPTQEPAP